MRRHAADPDCEMCAGTGEYETPFEERAGEIVGGNTIPCPCTKDYDDNEEIEDRLDAEGRDNESDSDGEDSGE